MVKHEVNYGSQHKSIEVEVRLGAMGALVPPVAAGGLIRVSDGQPLYGDVVIVARK
jgi:hypothetical protein